MKIETHCWLVVARFHLLFISLKGSQWTQLTSWKFFISTIGTINGKLMVWASKICWKTEWFAIFVKLFRLRSPIRFILCSIYIQRFWDSLTIFTFVFPVFITSQPTIFVVVFKLISIWQNLKGYWLMLFMFRIISYLRCGSVCVHEQLLPITMHWNFNSWFNIKLV